MIAIEDRGPVLLAVTWPLLAMSTGVFGLRMYVRHHFTHHFGNDDFWMGCTTALSFTTTVLISSAVSMGFGKHMEEAMPISSPKSLATISLALMAVTLIEILSIKLSITTFLLRLRPSTGYRVAIWAVILMNVVVTILGLLITFAQCQPLSLLWDPSQQGMCWSRTIMIDAIYTICVVCAVSWWVYIALPIAHSWNLQLPTYTKRAIWAILALGLIPATCAIVKTTYTVDMTDPDMTWTQVNFYIAYSVEMNVGIVIASIPALKPFIDSRWPGLLTASRSQASKSQTTSPKYSFGRKSFKHIGSSKSLTNTSNSQGSTIDAAKEHGDHGEHNSSHSLQDVGGALDPKSPTIVLDHVGD